MSIDHRRFLFSVIVIDCWLNFLLDFDVYWSRKFNFLKEKYNDYVWKSCYLVIEVIKALVTMIGE